MTAPETGRGTTPADREPRFALRTASILLPVLGVAGASVAVAAWLGGRLADSAGAAALGGVVSAATALLGVAILRPSVERPASDWMTAWLAATVARFLLTPLLAVSLYSALPLPGTPFLLAVAGTYLACLAVETAWLARSVGSALNHSAPRRGTTLPPGDRS